MSTQAITTIEAAAALGTNVGAAIRVATLMLAQVRRVAECLAALVAFEPPVFGVLASDVCCFDFQGVSQEEKKGKRKRKRIKCIVMYA